MCGIVGKLNFYKLDIDKEKEITLIKNSLEKLNHRGPDNSGYIIDNNVWLGSTRLSIIDLSPSGQQPMRNKDGTIFLVFNGEIYNYLELKNKLEKKYCFRSHTDTEVLLHLYQEYGEHCLKYLRGMFAFAIWDSRKKELFIARDRIGKKPLKYFYNNRFFIFASELKAFIDHPGVPREIDWDVIEEFFTYQYIPSPKTGFKNIWKLPPAHYMKVKSDGSIEIKRYWDLDFSHKLNLSEEEWMERISDKLKESVRIRLRSDVPLGIHLSGGVDSSLITALASEELSKPLNTFSIGFKESEYNELPFADAVARKYHTIHHKFIVKSNIIHLLPKLVYQYEEPFADPSILPTWYLMKESKKYITVALNGDGGDENFAGYQRYKYIYLIEMLKNVPFKKLFSIGFNLLYQVSKKRRFSIISRMINYSYENDIDYYHELTSFISSPLRNQLFSTSFKKKIGRSEYNKYFRNIFSRTNKNNDKLDKLLYLDINSYLPEYLMTKIDIASMAHSLEARSPFLDHEFMELSAKMPSNLKLKRFQSKYLLKKLTRSYIPDKCIYRSKQGFVPPLDDWFRVKLYKYIKLQLLDKNFLELNLFNQQEFYRLIDDHRQYKANNSYSLWSILILRNWLHTWFGI